MKHILPISMLAILTAMPAFADITNNSMCVVDVLNQSNNASTANINAMWSANPYTEPAGQYLQFANDTITQHVTCPAGSWCPGFTNQTFADATIGINTCPNGYTNSAQGSSANTDCYRACVTGANGDVPHSTGALTGGVYYNGTSGDGVNACEPTNCVTGYHVKPGLNLTTLIGVSEAGNGYTSNNSTGADYENENMSNTIIANDPLAFAVDYGNKGIIKGHGRCSTRNVANLWYDNSNTFESDHFTATLPNSTGQYCYCHLDSYTASGSQTSVALSGPWVFNNDESNSDNCTGSCAFSCAFYLQDSRQSPLAFRAAVFGTIQSGPASCAPNTINLTWYSVGDTVHETNQCTYDQPITLPATNPTKPGYTFAGWTLRQ